MTLLISNRGGARYTTDSLKKSRTSPTDIAGKENSREGGKAAQGRNNARNNSGLLQFNLLLYSSTNFAYTVLRRTLVAGE